MLDSKLMLEGMQTLIDRFGIVEAERFIYLVNKEPFDYTKWHHTLFDGMTMEEICEAAEIAGKQADERMKRNS